MDDKPTKRGGGAVAALGLLVVLLLSPVLYILSVGPAIQLAGRGLLRESVAAVYFWPVEWIINEVPVVGPVVESYAEWWMPPQPPPVYPASTAAPAPAAPPATVTATASP